LSSSNYVCATSPLTSQTRNLNHGTSKVPALNNAFSYVLEAKTKKMKANEQEKSGWTDSGTL